jgi:hypothetical protein
LTPQGRRRNIRDRAVRSAAPGRLAELRERRSGLHNKLIDTNGDSVGDTQFLDVAADAEAVRLNPASTKAQITAQKDLLERIDLGRA